MKKLAVLVLAIATSLAGVGPSFAENSGDEHSAQSRGGFGDSGARNSRGFDRCSIYRCGGYRHGRYGDRYYGNHSGNRYYRDGYYRGHNSDAGALLGGLAAGAIIGGLIASQPVARPVGNSHVDWCYSRYRSYRAYDNTYQPYYGPRRQCYSPY
ncbi:MULTISPECIES: BA14K family protein [Rhizobium]|uniref:Lectin-like protein BA14k n=1 Tax=Rhizobium favelukesii TaxID=348824 RepID=W6R8E0_9HYPH|nr:MULTISPECIES: BA14K family protein [Rhizobium]MCA0801647.1 BA14K family protein [Rhizobium sp. T1473]MCS0462733.1 BA14K family protein [Rhizobium favelukesii]UFS80961.1 BA14K family protein [Rhizobium sp. T136]CDM57507.1 Lectin-like protein BA14k [Rhizobium favelukesii]